MLNLDDLFKDQFDHPKLRYWQDLGAQHGTSPEVEVVRPRDGLGFARTAVHVTVRDANGAVVTTDVEPWEPQMVLSTVERGWRAPTSEREIERFGILLKTLFAPIETRYGDGYFSSVLVEVLQDSEFSKEPSVAELLGLIKVPPAYVSSNRADCVANIKAVLARVAQWIAGPLNYTRDDAKAILTRAVTYFLDERFSITAGRMLGLYSDDRRAN